MTTVSPIDSLVLHVLLTCEDESGCHVSDHHPSFCVSAYVDVMGQEPAAAAKPAVQVSAGQVKQLRDKSGAGMMDCKKALAECNGDVEVRVCRC